MSRPTASLIDDEFAALYPEVRRIARSALRRGVISWRGEQTLNTTALVHESFLRLRSSDAAQWKDEGHFLALVARTMRFVLVDAARARGRVKRGQQGVKVPLEDDLVLERSVAEEVLAVDQALEKIGEIDVRLVRVVECRFLLGLTVEETAQALGVSTMTVKRDWLSARALMAQELRLGVIA